MYPLKGTSFERVYVVFCARVVLGCFTIRQKRIRGGGAFAEGNSASLKQRRSSYEYPHCVSATRRLALDNRPTQLNSPNTYTHTRCRPTLNWAAVDSETGRGHGKSEEGWRAGMRAGTRGGTCRGGREGGRDGMREGNEGGRGGRE